MKFILCVVIIILSSSAFCQKSKTTSAAKGSSSQSVFKTGYIVPFNGDTIHGFVKEVYYPFYPKYLKFSSSQDSKFDRFEPEQVSAFGTIFNSPTGEIELKYEVHAFKFDGDRLGHKELSYPISANLGFPTTRLPVKWIDEKCFLRLHARGHYSLYSFIDPDDNVHFFISSKDSPELVELQHRDYLVFKEGVSSIATSKYYQQQLMNLAGSCKTKIKFLNLFYHEKQLTRAVEAINKCYEQAK
jgi:hypothetical protein